MRAAPDQQERLLAAVRAEQEVEAEALKALYHKTSLKRLEKEGVVLAGLRCVVKDLQALYHKMGLKCLEGMVLAGLKCVVYESEVG